MAAQASNQPDATLLYAQVPSLKGRGMVWALEHRFSSSQRQVFDDGWGTLERVAAVDAGAGAIDADDFGAVIGKHHAAKRRRTDSC